MKKLSEINETSWGGMVRRSSSDVVRKQDEFEWIDLGPEFDCLWLNGVYEKEGKTRFKWSEVKEIVRSMPDLRLPKFEEVKKLNVELYKGTLYIEGTENHLDPIKDGWRIWNDRGGVIVLGINTAKIRLSLIDDEYPFTLVKPKAINETSWGGMVRRSSGDVVRKENWLNGLGRCEFYDHLKKTYDIRYGRNIILSRDQDWILVPITGQRAPMYLYLVYENDKLMEIYYYSSNKSLAVTLSDTFDVRYSRNNIINITAPNGDVNNEVAIDVIDTISNIVTSPATVRKNELNETSWGGMVRRSSGGMVRKQDELDDETRKCLDDYIEGFIELCGSGYDMIEPTLNEFVEYIKNGRGEGDDEYIDTLLKYVPFNWNKGENIESKILNGVK